MRPEETHIVMGRAYPAVPFIDEGTRDAAIRRIAHSAFPSLSLMQVLPARHKLPRGVDLMAILHGDEPAVAAPPNAPRPTLRWFPGGPGHPGKWRCALRSCGSFNVTGWGSTHNRAWNAWVDAWNAGHPKEQS